jgi:hypothetical protein
MNHFTNNIIKPETQVQEFEKLFPKDKNRTLDNNDNIISYKYRNLRIINGKITHIETDDKDIIEFIKSKGLFEIPL